MLEQPACECQDTDNRQLANAMKVRFVKPSLHEMWMSMAQETDWRCSIDIMCLEGPQTWQLLKLDSLQEFEEVVFTMQGIVCSMELPPIMEKPSWVHVRDSHSLMCVIWQSKTSTLQVPPTEFVHHGATLKADVDSFCIDNIHLHENYSINWKLNFIVGALTYWEKR
jgi:hypothetical protein